MTTKKLKETLNSGVLMRDVPFFRENINEEARTVELAFSSEAPVERWYGTEVLDHSRGSVRLGRMQDGGALLVNHDGRDHIGVVDKVSIDDDKVGRAVVRFGNSNRAEEIFRDVVDGIRRSISVGYRIYEGLETIGSGSAESEIRITDWEPLEISLVAVPADPSVGVGRAQQEAANTFEIFTTDEDRSMDVNNQPGEPGEKPAAPAKVDVAAIEKDAREKELKRVRTIYELGDKHQQRELAQRMVENGKTVDEMREAILDVLEKGPNVSGEMPDSDLDLSNQEKKHYSLLNAIRASVTGDWSKAGFELECSNEIADRLEREARGFFVPYDIQAEKRATMTTGAPATGGTLVGTEHLASEFIDRLKARTVLGRMNARILPGLVGNIDIPRLESGATFYWLAEDADVSDSDLGTGSVLMSPKTVAGSVPMSRRLLKQSTPYVEEMVRDDLETGAALAIDKAGLVGGGTNEPVGIYLTTGVSTNAVATPGQPTFKEIVDFETLIDEAEALQESLGYITTKPIRGHLKTTPRDAGSGVMLAEGNETNGYRLEATSQIPANGIIFGNFRDVIIGYWGVLDVMPDPAAKAASGGLVLRVFQDADIAVRRPLSFCVNS